MTVATLPNFGDFRPPRIDLNEVYKWHVTGILQSSPKGFDKFSGLIKGVLDMTRWMVLKAVRR